jgi:hypothetical protein
MKRTAGLLLGLTLICLYTCEPKKTPVLTSLSPDNEISATSSFQLVAKGSDFEEGSQIIFNGRVKATTRVSPAELRCEITASDLTFVPESSLIRTVPVRVRTSEAKESNRLDFTIYGYPVFLPAKKIADSTTSYSDTLHPLIDIDEDKNLYVVWRDLTTLFFSFSADGGSAWSSPTQIAAAASPSFRFAMAVQKTTGTIYVVWEDGDVIYFSWSSDSGQTWAARRALTQRTAWKASHPGIFLDSSGKLYVPYLNSNINRWEFSVNLLKSTDNGNTFSAAGRIDWYTYFTGENCPEICADNTGLLYIVFPSDLNTKYSTNYLAFSLDAGLTWSEPQMISCLLPALATDDENGLNIIGSKQLLPSSHDLQFQRTIDRGATWINHDFTDTGYSVSDIWINPLGGTDIIWGNLFVRSYDRGVNWKPRVQYTDMETADGPSFVEDGSGRVYIVWWNGDGGIYFTGSKSD